MSGKLNVQGPSQKRTQLVQKSSQPLARRRAKGLTHSLKLNPEQKAGSTRKVTKAAQSPLARDRKCMAPKNGKLPQSSDDTLMARHPD